MPVAGGGLPVAVHKWRRAVWTRTEEWCSRLFAPSRIASPAIVGLLYSTSSPTTGFRRVHGWHGTAFGRPRQPSVVTGTIGVG